MSEHIDNIRNIALDLLELATPACTDLDYALLDISKKLYELVEDEEVRCDICGDEHNTDNIPLSCKSGDGV